MIIIVVSIPITKEFIDRPKESKISDKYESGVISTNRITDIWKKINFYVVFYAPLLTDAYIQTDFSPIILPTKNCAIF